MPARSSGRPSGRPGGTPSRWGARRCSSTRSCSTRSSTLPPARRRRRRPRRRRDAPEPHRQGDGIDFGSLEELDAIPLFATPPPRRFGLVPRRAASSRASPRPRPRKRAAPARRTTCSREARSLHGEGKNAEALGVLARIAILDEENAEAHELEGASGTAMDRAVLQVDGWIIEGVQAFDRGEIDAARSCSSAS